MKESDRIAALAENLRRMGAKVEERRMACGSKGGSAAICAAPRSIPTAITALRWRSGSPALGADGATTIKDAECAAVSFPNFFEILSGLVER